MHTIYKRRNKINEAGDSSNHKMAPYKQYLFSCEFFISYFIRKPDKWLSRDQDNPPISVITIGLKNKFVTSYAGI